MKKNFSVLFALALLLLVFAGCQKADPQLQEVHPSVHGQQVQVPNKEVILPDHTPEQAAEAAETTTPTEAPAKELTKEEAEQIALQHAGLDRADVTYLRTEADRDDRVSHFDVDFRKDDYEYDYEIALDGTVLKHEKEYDPVSKPAVQTPPPTEAPAQTTTEKLTREEAKKIALDHAGLKESQVTRLQVEYDRDDGIAKYEVDFEKDRFEYSYEINAESGKILDTDKEYDD